MFRTDGTSSASDTPAARIDRQTNGHFWHFSKMISMASIPQTIMPGNTGRTIRGEMGSGE
jgi:hypothetical protein